MTQADFLTQSLTFIPGKIYVLSSQDITQCLSFLSTVQTYIQGHTSNTCLIFRSDAEITYLSRFYETNTTEGKVWESEILTDTNFVILIAHQFDPNNSSQNHWNVDLGVDVTMNFIHPPINIPISNSRRYPTTRELFPFITSLYFFDINSNQITFIKNSSAERP